MGGPLPENLTSFRAEYKTVFDSARRAAEKKLGASLSFKARSQTTCWSLLRKLRSPSRSVAIDSETLLNHFRSVFYDPSEPLFFHPSTLGIAAPTNYSVPLFSDNELVKALKLLNSQAATGPQRVASRYLKHVFQNDQARVPLLFLMNWCFREGVIPSKWGVSEVFILYKGKGNVTDPINYRGINLNDDFLRLYERLLNERMQTWLKNSRPWGSQQFGFSQGVSTDNAFLCLEALGGFCTRVKKVPLFATFIDLQRAFPSMLRSKALLILHEMGLLYELLAAFASTFSGNSCRLQINDKLTQSFFVNRGTKEGGINSPSIFNTVYAYLLKKVGVSDYPSDPNDFDPEKVYHLVFADDLVILGANKSKLEQLKCDLDIVLSEVGMKINAGKTKWLAYLPTEISPSFSSPISTGFKYGSAYLENVDLFKYLGFTTSWNLAHNDHVQSRSALMILAARMMGKLMRSLEVTNFRSLRAYFYSLVASQMYSTSVITFDEEVFERAQKVFLQEALNLPNSFAYHMAKFFLNVDEFLLLSFDARVKFLQRIANGNSDTSLSAMIMDREFLLPCRIGWSAGFYSLFEGRWEFHELDLLDEDDAGTARSRLVSFIDLRNLDRLRASAASYIVDIFPDLVLPPPLATYLGNLPFESVRIFVIFLANMMQWTYLRSSAQTFPFCRAELSSPHLFLCSGARNNPLCDWGRFVLDLQESLYQDALDRLFLLLQRWNTLTNNFTPGFSDRVDEYFEFTAYGSRKRNSLWPLPTFSSH